MSRLQNKHNESKSKYSVANSLVNYYLVTMFSFFPLFLTNQYAHARKDKFWFFLIATAVLVISVGICLAISCGEAKRSCQQPPSFLPLTVTDILMLSFLGLAAISTVLSPYPADALFGTAGRDNGLVLLLMYTLMYFTVTRVYVQKDYVFIIYLVVSSVIALLTVLNFFYIDPFGLLKGYDEATAADFGSTLGNKNIIAAFMCLFMPIAVMLFVVSEKNRVLRRVALAAIPFAYTGLLCADSSSDILGLLIILPVTAIFSARSRDYLQRYLLALAVMFASGKLLRLFALLLSDHNKGFELMQTFLIYSPWMYVPIGVCLIGWALMRFTGQNARYPAKTVQVSLSVLFIFGIIAGLGTFIYFSAIDTKTDLGQLQKLLRFDDSWGTHRGFMWRVSLDEFSKSDILRMLFGSGPDTAYYVLSPHFSELSARFGDTSTNCAHNEYINYLLTQGILGLGAYLGLMISVVLRGLKAAKKNPVSLAFICAILCYLAQSVVNLYNPIVTPLLFIFVSLTEALNRNTDADVREQEL